MSSRNSVVILLVCLSVFAIISACAIAFLFGFVRFIWSDSFGPIAQVNQHYVQGFALQQQGDREKALDEYDSAARAGYKNPLMYLSMSEISGSLGRYSVGLEYNAEALSLLESTDSRIHALPGPEQDLLNNPERRRALVVRAHIQRAHLLLETGNTEACSNALLTIQTLAPQESSSEYLDVLGRLAVHNQDWPEAVRAFRVVVSQSPNYYDAHFYLGMALCKTGDLKTGKVELKNYLDKAPSASKHIALARELLAGEGQ